MGRLRAVPWPTALPKKGHLTVRAWRDEESTARQRARETKTCAICSAPRGKYGGRPFCERPELRINPCADQYYERFWLSWNCVKRGILRTRFGSPSPAPGEVICEFCDRACYPVDLSDGNPRIGYDFTHRRTLKTVSEYLDVRLVAVVCDPCRKAHPTKVQFGTPTPVEASSDGTQLTLEGFA